MTQIIDIKRAKLDSDFEPSMKSLLRIIKAMIENGAESKTQLSLDTNLNYARLAKHIVWMEKKGFVESTIKDNKINVVLTKNGRAFSSIITNPE